MNRLRLPAVLLSMCLQAAPLLRVAVVGEAAASPLVALVRLMVWGAAMSGAVDAVSGATGVTITQGNAIVTSPLGTNGMVCGFRVQVSSAQYGIARSYSFGLLPRGLAGNSLGIVSGIPSVSGVFNVPVTGWQFAGEIGFNYATFVKIVITNGFPFIINQPIGVTVAVGAPLTLAVGASGGDLEYQWFQNALPLPGATNAAFMTPAAQPTNAGAYTVVVSNSVGSVMSLPAAVQVTEPPTIVTAPKDQTVYEGEPWGLSVQATGTGPFTYRWVFDGKSILGATNATWSFPSADKTQAGSYSVTVTGPGGSTLAGPVHVVVVSPPTLEIIAVPGSDVFLLSFDAVAGRSYALESRPHLLSGAWAAGPTLSATGATVMAGAIETNTAGFYRVAVLPPSR